MLHYLIELALWILASFFAGCCVWCLLKNLFGSDAAVEAPASVIAAPVVRPVSIAVPAAAATVTAAAASTFKTEPPLLAVPTGNPTPRPAMAAPVAPVPMPKPVMAAAPLVAASARRMERPKGITVARGGKADDLLRIAGVGPKNEKILHSLGFYHFDQIADWTPSQVAWVDDHLQFNGRIDREEWINQCKLLRDGKDAEFARLYGTGGAHRGAGDILPDSKATMVSTAALKSEVKNDDAAAAAKAKAADDAAAAGGKMLKPRGLTKARGGKADDLQRISGIGPKNESILHGLGFFHFDQIAAWTSTEVNWVDDHLRFGGRIKREEWIRQARLLADGKEAEFTRLYGTGGLKNKKGETLSGTRTRK